MKQLFTKQWSDFFIVRYLLNINMSMFNFNFQMIYINQLNWAKNDWDTYGRGFKTETMHNTSDFKLLIWTLGAAELELICIFILLSCSCKVPFSCKTLLQSISMFSRRFLSLLFSSSKRLISIFSNGTGPDNVNVA